AADRREQIIPRTKTAAHQRAAGEIARRGHRPQPDIGRVQERARIPATAEAQEPRRRPRRRPQVCRPAKLSRLVLVRILTLISKCPWPLTDGAAIRDFNLLREA